MVSDGERTNGAMAASQGGNAIGGLVVLLITFIVLYSIIHSAESGDTLRYSGDVVHHAHGESAQFWEFGHLLWRPWGGVGLKLFGSWFERTFGDSDVQAVARFFVVTNFVCCLLILALLWDLLRHLVTTRIATLTAIAFCGANCFLDYVSVGSAYLPALCFECLALWLIANGLSQERPSLAWVCFGGMSYAMAILLWFPYSFAVLGMVMFIVLWPVNSSWNQGLPGWYRRRFLQTIGFLVIVGFTYLAILSIGARADGIHNVAQFKQWIIDSDSGWSQHLNIARAATGVPRSLFELASDTILLKRWFFHDPYNPVHLGQLAGALFLKLALFYLGIAALLWLLICVNSARRFLVVLLGAALPLLFFAIVIFEPGSTSRYLPLLPFLYLAAAIALATNSKQKVAYSGVILLLCSAFLLNVFTLTHSLSARAADVYSQRNLLDQQITGHGLVFIPTLHDAFYEVPLTRPIDHRLASSKYLTVDIVESASTRLLHWRAEFASRALEAWRAGEEVWISQRAFAKLPESSWPWVEGDDPRVHWADLPSFFDQLQSDRTIGSGHDGFLRITDNESNKSLLENLIAADSRFGHQPSDRQTRDARKTY